MNNSSLRALMIYGLGAVVSCTTDPIRASETGPPKIAECDAAKIESLYGLEPGDQVRQFDISSLRLAAQILKCSTEVKDAELQQILRTHPHALYFHTYKDISLDLPRIGTSYVVFNFTDLSGTIDKIGRKGWPRRLRGVHERSNGQFTVDRLPNGESEDPHVSGAELVDPARPDNRCFDGDFSHCPPASHRWFGVILYQSP